jgi:hypothetical protein
MIISFMYFDLVPPTFLKVKEAASSMSDCCLRIPML